MKKCLFAVCHRAKTIARTCRITMTCFTEIPIQPEREKLESENRWTKESVNSEELDTVRVDVLKFSSRAWSMYCSVVSVVF